MAAGEAIPAPPDGEPVIAPGGDGDGEGGAAASALPSVQARLLAFLLILGAGVCGGLIGGSFVSLQCHGDCTTPVGLGGVIGASVAAGGVAVVAVLTLRAMGEWHTIKADREREAERRLVELGMGPEVRDAPPAPIGPGDSDRGGYDDTGDRDHGDEPSERGGGESH